MKRYLEPYIRDDLKKKMVFLGGPRQVGKTTLSLNLLAENASKDLSLLTSDKMALSPAYLTWDLPEDRNSILKNEIPKGEPLIVLDEIHKYSKWRNLVKGIYDTHKSERSFLITGSARLDYYRRGGDSLQGRYHYYRLHPLSLGELIKSGQHFSIEDFLQFGGFPEPYYAKNMREYKRWQRSRNSRVIREDLVDLERIMDISSMQLLVDTLPSRIGSPLSIKSLSEDLQVAQQTVARWITVLENLYFCFRITPYGAPKIRAVKKEQKLYLWDWSLCQDSGAKFENFVASQLLKQCHFIEDTEGDKMELRYVRDHDKREVDFVVLKNNAPLYGVECKSHDTDISSHLKYFRDRTPIPKWYQVHLGTKHFEKDGIEVIPFIEFVRKMDFV